MTTPKRILCISRAYGEYAGGMERLSFELISELEKDPDLRVDTIVHETKSGVTLFAARIQSLLFVLGVLPRALRQSRNAEIVHIGDPVLSVVGWVLMRVRKVPVAVTVHGLDVAYANPLYQLYLNLFFQGFSAYLPISDYARKLLEKRKIQGNVQVITPGIRDHFYDPALSRDDLAKLLRRDISGTKVLATTGRLVSRKGHAWFIENVLPYLPKNTLYVAAGSGPESQNLTSLIKRLNLEEKVLLLGRISSEDQGILLNTIDAFIQPNISVSRDGEGFGIAPLEAALCGRMVFASDVDGIPSAIHSGKNGILLPHEDAESWIRGIGMFLEGKEVVGPTDVRSYTLEAFNWKNIAKKYREVFQALA